MGRTEASAARSRACVRRPGLDAETV